MWQRQGWKRYWLILAGMALILAGAVAASADEFPLRAKHPTLTFIDTKELTAIFDQAVIVDARDVMEYKVIHMKGAKNFPVSKMTETELQALRPKDGAAPMVFYCNGINCEKSYNGAEKAVKWGFANVKVYDAGIFAWAESQPERTVILDVPQTVESIKTALMSKDKLAAHMLSTADFIAKSKDAAYTVIDIRDTNEKKEIPIKLPKLKAIPLDTMVKLIKEKSPAVPTKNILIIDTVGQQVMWVQYYLEQAGITDYYFLKGGAGQWKKDGYKENGEK